MSDPSEQHRSAPSRVWAWLCEDADRTLMAVSITVLSAVAYAGSAAHILRVGAYPHVAVNGLLVWTVAGSLEWQAAVATYEFRRRSGRDALTPAVVLAVSLTFILLANLAAADEQSWAARLPWAQAFALVPPVSLVFLLAIADTKSWKLPHRRPGRSGSSTRSGQAGQPGQAGQAGQAGGSGPSGQSGPGSTRSSAESRGRGSGAGRGSAGSGERSSSRTAAGPAAGPAGPQPGSGPGAGPASGPNPRPNSDRTGTHTSAGSSSNPGPSALTALPGHERSAVIARWVQEGHRWTDVVQAGVTHFGVSEATIKRDISKARQAHSTAAGSG